MNAIVLPSGDQAASPSYSSGLATCVSCRTFPLARSTNQQPGSPVPLGAENGVASVGRDRWIEILGGVAHRVGDGARGAAACGQRPQLAEQIEDDGAVVRREVEGQLRPFARVNRNGLCHLLLGVRDGASSEEQRQTNTK